MAIGNFTQLSTAVASWLNRRDLAAQIPDFITLAEKDMWEVLRDRRMMNTVNAQSDCGHVALPADWLEAVSIRMKGAAQPLRYIPLSEVTDARQYPGMPVQDADVADQIHCTRFYTIRGPAILDLLPPPADDTAEVSMVYYAQPAALTATNLVNWVITDKPGLYLYGTLLQAAPYLVDDDRVPLWKAMYTDLLAKANMSSSTALHSGGVLVRGRRGFG